LQGMWHKQKIKFKRIKSFCVLLTPSEKE